MLPRELFLQEDAAPDDGGHAVGLDDRRGDGDVRRVGEGEDARKVLELAGYKNIRTKSLGSNNKQNVVLATIEGLKAIKSPEEIAKLRGKSLDEILN